jgi:hypothetical protein
MYSGLRNTRGLLRNESYDMTVSGAESALAGAVENRVGLEYDRDRRRLGGVGPAGIDGRALAPRAPSSVSAGQEASVVRR